MTEFGLSDVGNILILTVMEDDVAKDISDATVKEYFIKRPNEITVKVTASFNTDGTDGKLKYVFVATDLDFVGLYEVQVSLETPLWDGKSTSYFFTVRETLSFVIASWSGTSTAFTLKSTLCHDIITGKIILNPGFIIPVYFPKKNLTPLSYSFTILRPAKIYATTKKIIE